MQQKKWPKLVLPVLLAVGAWALFRNRVDGGVVPTAVGPAPSADVASSSPLLSGLKRGDKLGEWTVDQLVFNKAPNGSPQLAIELERKGSGVTVWIARRDKAAGAPLETRDYAVSHGHPRPNGEPIPEGASFELAQKIVERIKANEPTAPPIPQLQ